MRPSRLRLLPDALFSAPVLGLSLVWAVAVQLGEVAATSVGDAALRIALLVVAQAVMFAIPYVTWRVLCPRVRPSAGLWLLLASIVVGAVVRGVVFGVLLFLTGATRSPDLAFRIVASANHMVVVTVLLWFFVSEVRQLHARRRRLVADRDQLLALQGAAQADLDRLGDRAIASIRESILDSLGGLGAAGSAELLQRLRLIIDDIVRPLSHQLVARAPAWTPPQPPIEAMRVDWPRAARDGLDPARIHPVIVTVALIWLGLPLHVLEYGGADAALLVATAIVAIPVFWLSRRLAIRSVAGRGAGARAVAFLLAVVAGGASLGLATLAYMADRPEPFVFVVMGPVLALLISAPLAVAEAARDQDLALEAELEATTADLRWTLARAREQHRQQERALAHALHGRVQASLAAAIVRLDRAVARGDDDETLRGALHDEILRSVAELDARGSQPKALDQVIALTERNWSGAAEIRCWVSPEARQALVADRLCATAVNDLVPELVFNSFRHGSATSIEIRLALDDPRTLALTVTDDGALDPRQVREGLGTRLLDEAAITWSRTRDGDRTRTTCLLPCTSLAVG